MTGDSQLPLPAFEGALSHSSWAAQVHTSREDDC